MIIFTVVKLINFLHNLQMCGGVSSEIQDLIVNGSWCRVVMVTRNSDRTISQTIVFNICSDNNLQPGDNTELHFTILNIKWIEYKIDTKSQFSRWWRVDVIFSIPPPCWWYAWYQFQDNSTTELNQNQVKSYWATIPPVTFSCWKQSRFEEESLL